MLAVQATSVAAPNQIAAYSFDQGSGTTVADASGNNYIGTLKNGPTWTAGKYNGALTFDGSNDYVAFGDVAPANGLTAFTVSTWVKFAVSGGGSHETHLVDKSRCDGYRNSGPWELGVALTAPGKAEVLVYPQDGTPSAYIFSGASTSSVDDGNWHYVTARYDGSRLSIWVDGRQENSVAAAGLRMSSTTHAMEAGGNCNGYAYPFRGTLDEIRVYARALSQTEIQADMTTALGGAAPPTSPADTTPPSVPANLTVVHKTATEAGFSWSASSDNVAVTGYRIFRNGVQVGTSAQTTYTDRGLTANTAYSYTVSAHDAAGNSSAHSQPLSITTSAESGGGGGGSTSGASYSTAFNLTENPLSEGGRWRRANNPWTNVQTIGGVAFGANSVGHTYDDSYALLSGFGPDQTVEAVVYRDTSLSPEARTRSSSCCDSPMTQAMRAATNACRSLRCRFDREVERSAGQLHRPAARPERLSGTAAGQRRRRQGDDRGQHDHDVRERCAPMAKAIDSTFSGGTARYRILHSTGRQQQAARTDELQGDLADQPVKSPRGRR